MGDLEIVKRENFEGVECDFFKGEDEEIYMTSEQLGQALGYADPRISIGNIVSRNDYLRNEEFSSIINLMTEAGIRETRVFTEDGIYEVTLLSKTEVAKKFRTWVRQIIKDLRAGRSTVLPMNNSLETVKLINKQVGILIESQQELSNKIENIDKKVDTQITLLFNQAKEIQFAVKRRVIGLLGGKNTDEYELNKSKYFGAIHKDIKKRLGVPSYRDILKKDYETALKFIENWIPEADIRM